MNPEFQTILGMDHFRQLTSHEDAVLVYFSHQHCNVCKVLKPKIAEMVSNHFPRIKLTFLDTVKFPEVAGQQSIFTVPTLLIFFGGREYIRVSRNISVSQLQGQIRRPYELMFN